MVFIHALDCSRIWKHVWKWPYVCSLGNLFLDTVYQERSISYFAFQLATGIITGSYVFTLFFLYLETQQTTDYFLSNLGKRRNFPLVPGCKV